MRVKVKPQEMLKGDLLISEFLGEYLEVDGYIRLGVRGAEIAFAGGVTTWLNDRQQYEVERPVAPTTVVVDTYWGYVFSSGADGVPFTYEPARSFAAERNDGLKVPTYKVFRLVPDED